MIWLWLVLIAAVVLAGWYLFRPRAISRDDSRREAEARKRRLEQRLVRTPEDMAGLGDIRALTLRAPASGKVCAAARERLNQTFVTHEAPPLPLPDCDLPRCECSYFAVPGRRSGVERRQGGDRREETRFEPGKGDRRSGKDRRRGGRDPWKGRA